MEELTYYLEWKNELKYSNSAYEKTVNHLRPGVKFKNFYWEGGDTLKHKLETEVRFTF